LALDLCWPALLPFDLGGIDMYIVQGSWRIALLVLTSLSLIGGFLFLWKGSLADPPLAIFGLCLFGVGILLGLLCLFKELPKNGGH